MTYDQACDIANRIIADNPSLDGITEQARRILCADIARELGVVREEGWYAGVARGVQAVGVLQEC